ncbi:MAG: hypothetical protein L6R41_003427 [Letrouitia leprolyta]|nr:MAG: hypothetical protein L6R41_003427 [Letrouitia leprolyta]
MYLFPLDILRFVRFHVYRFFGIRLSPTILHELEKFVVAGQKIGEERNVAILDQNTRVNDRTLVQLPRQENPIGTTADRSTLSTSNGEMVTSSRISTASDITLPCQEDPDLSLPAPPSDRPQLDVDPQKDTVESRDKLAMSLYEPGPESQGRQQGESSRQPHAQIGNSSEQLGIRTPKTIAPSSRPPVLKPLGRINTSFDFPHLYHGDHEAWRFRMFPQGNSSSQEGQHAPAHLEGDSEPPTPTAEHPFPLASKKNESVPDTPTSYFSTLGGEKDQKPEQTVSGTSHQLIDSKGEIISRSNASTSGFDSNLKAKEPRSRLRNLIAGNEPGAKTDGPESQQIASISAFKSLRIIEDGSAEPAVPALGLQLFQGNTDTISRPGLSTATQQAATGDETAQSIRQSQGSERRTIFTRPAHWLYTLMGQPLDLTYGYLHDRDSRLQCRKVKQAILEKIQRWRDNPQCRGLVPPDHKIKECIRFYEYEHCKSVKREEEIKHEWRRYQSFVTSRTGRDTVPLRVYGIPGLIDLDILKFWVTVGLHISTLPNLDRMAYITGAWPPDYQVRRLRQGDSETIDSSIITGTSASV